MVRGIDKAAWIEDTIQGWVENSPDNTLKNAQRFMYAVNTAQKEFTLSEEEDITLKKLETSRGDRG